MARSYTCSKCRASITIQTKEDINKWWNHLDTCQLIDPCRLCGAPGGNCQSYINELHDDR